MSGPDVVAPVTWASTPAELAVGPLTYLRIELIVHAASAAVSGRPSDHLARGRVWKVQVSPSAECCQLVAKSGTMFRLALYWTSSG